MAQSKGLNNVFKLGGIVSVKEPRFGAVGDGVTDDTTGIQAAIDSLSEGVVFFPKTSNYYNITAELAMKSSVSLRGEGYGSRIHRDFTANSQNIINCNAKTNLSISNLRITGNVTSSPDNGNARIGILIQQRSIGVSVKRCWINQVDTGIKGGGGTEDISVSGACVIGPMVHDGIQPVGNALVGGLGSIYWKIINNYIETQNTLNATAIYMNGPATGYLIEGNTLVGGKYGWQLAVTSPSAEGDTRQHRFVNNIIVSPNIDGMLVVDADNATYNILDITVSGNKVMSPTNSGMLFEGVKGLVVAGNTILSPGQSGIGVIKSGAYTHHNYNATVTGNVVRGGGNGSALLAGIKLESSDYCSVVGNTVDAFNGQGIFVTGTAGADDSLDNIISGNTLTNNTNYGLRVSGGSRTRIGPNVYAGNTLGEVWDSHTTSNMSRHMQPATTVITQSAPSNVYATAVLGWMGSNVYKVTIPTAAWTAAALTQDVNIGRLLAKSRLAKVIMDVTQAFAGTGWGSATLQLGKTTGGTEYMVAYDATVLSRKGLLDADLGASLVRAAAVQGGDLPSWTADTNLTVRLTTTVANISLITAGAVTLYLTVETLP